MGEGLDHIGFVVDDVEATYHELLAKGAEPTGIDPNGTDGWTASLKDPDGNWVEIYQVTEPIYRGQVPRQGPPTAWRGWNKPSDELLELGRLG